MWIGLMHGVGEAAERFAILLTFGDEFFGRIGVRMPIPDVFLVPKFPGLNFVFVAVHHEARVIQESRDLLLGIQAVENGVWRLIVLANRWRCRINVFGPAGVITLIQRITVTELHFDRDAILTE